MPSQDITNDAVNGAANRLAMPLMAWSWSLKALLLLAFGAFVSFPGCLSVQAASYNVQDYGAKGDGVADDSAAIQKAVNAAITAGSGSVVSVPAGTYLLAHSVTLLGATNLTFRGASPAVTEFLTTPVNGQVIHIQNCKNVTVGSFSIDGQVLNFTQGTITADSSADSAITVKLDAGYPALDAPQLVGAHSLYTFHNPSRLSYDGDHPNIRSRSMAQTGVWQLALDHLPVDVYPGEKIAVWNVDKLPPGCAIGVDNSSNVTLSNINHYCGGWCMPTICGGNTGFLNFTNFNVGPPADSGRLITAQGGMAAYNRAAITLKNCDWRGIDDDCFDISGVAAHILSQQAPDRITIGNAHWGTDYQAGDTLQVWGWANGNASIRSTAHITAVSSAGGVTTLTLDSPVIVLNPDPNDSGGGWDGFDRIYDLDQAGPIVVTGCKLQSNRARAALLKSGVSITVNNSVIYGGRGLPALNCGMEGETGEGPGPSNITITGNTFYGNDGPCIFVGNDNSYFLTAARNILGANVTISSNTFRDNCLPNPNIGKNPQQYANPVPVLVTCMKNVTISGNLFSNNWGPNIGLFADADVRVLGNTFVRPNQIQGWSEATFATLATVIYADNTQGFTLSGNTVSQPGPYTNSLLYTTSSVTGLSGATHGITTHQLRK